MVGWITIRRAYYHGKTCGKGRSPYDERSGSGGRPVRPSLAQACCLWATEDSFEESSRKVDALVGQKVSDDTIERVVRQVVGKRVKGSGMMGSRKGSSSTDDAFAICS